MKTMAVRTSAAIVAGFVLAATLQAQNDTMQARRDTMAVNPLTPRDTSRDTTVVIPRRTHVDTVKKIRADSIQPRIGRDQAMLSLEIGKVFTYTRDEYFNSGALMLTDILARIPGVTTFQNNWMHAVQVVAYNGDLGRLRIFYDGIELAELNSRQNGVYDLSAIPTWSLQRMTIIRGANELRIDIQSWEYNNVRPYTQFDVLTGDVQTAIYRGFYAKRFYNGAGLQFAGERFNDADLRFSTSGDRTTLFGRYGVAKENWSADVTLLHGNATRTLTPRFNAEGMAMAPFRAAYNLLYVRGAIGKEGNGPFLQVIASGQRLGETSPHFSVSSASPFGFPSDTTDSTTSVSQYVATAGFDRWGGRVRLTDRYRTTGHGQHFNAISGSFDFSRNALAFSALIEDDAYSGFTRYEASARVEPVPFFAISGSVGTRNSDVARNGQPDSKSARGEVGVRLFKDGPWLLGGVLTRDTTLAIAPTVFDTAFRTIATGRTTGTTLALRGPLKYGFSVNGQGTHWNTDRGPYTPKYEAWGELKFYTQWLSKFPSGDFSFTVAPRVEYRSGVGFPRATGELFSAPSTVYSALIQIRIMRGVATYERRNLAGSIFEQVPGYIMPRAVNVYGVRWYFFD